MANHSYICQLPPETKIRESERKMSRQTERIQQTGKIILPHISLIIMRKMFLALLHSLATAEMDDKTMTVRRQDFAEIIRAIIELSVPSLSSHSRVDVS